MIEIPWAVIWLVALIGFLGGLQIGMLMERDWQNFKKRHKR